VIGAYFFMGQRSGQHLADFKFYFTRPGHLGSASKEVFEPDFRPAE